jgi:hypothetical protein
MGNRLARALSVLVFTFLVGCNNDQGSQLTPEPQSRTPGPALDEDSPFAKALNPTDEQRGAVPKK